MLCGECASVLKETNKRSFSGTTSDYMVESHPNYVTQKEVSTFTNDKESPIGLFHQPNTNPRYKIYFLVDFMNLVQVTPFDTYDTLCGPLTRLSPLSKSRRRPHM